MTTSDLSSAELAELRRLLEAATPGPWTVDDSSGHDATIAVGESVLGDGDEHGYLVGMPIPIARLIAALVNAAPRLIEMASEAREAAAVERERVATAMLEHAAVLRERRGMHTNGPADTCRHQIADAFGNYARNVLRARGRS